MNRVQAAQLLEQSMNLAGSSDTTYLRLVADEVAKIDSEELAIAFTLQDVLAAGGLTKQDLFVAGTPPRALAAVEAIASVGEESMEDWLARVIASQLASRVINLDLALLQDGASLRLEFLPQLRAESRDRVRTALASRQALDTPDDLGGREIGWAYGETVAWHLSNCAVCGHPAGSLTLIGASEEDSGNTPHSLLACGPLGLVSSTLKDVEPTRTAVTNGDLEFFFHENDEFVTWYCGHCEDSYCSRHWETETLYDDGFYDCTYGTCPKGHRRKLDD